MLQVPVPVNESDSDRKGEEGESEEGGSKVFVSCKACGQGV